MEKNFISDRYDPANSGRSAPSRRTFIKGVIACGAVVGTTSFIVGCSDNSAPAAGSVERLVTLNVNGKSRPVDVLPNETLAMTLRNKLGLTGTKLGCDRGACGACTVMIDGVTRNSCSILTHTVRSANITTIEGIGGGDAPLHAVQQAMIEELAPQCGYCTPGQVVSGVSLLQRNPNPTREEVRQALSGNLCRCGAYNNYIDAVMIASERI
ncbi:MAG: (2Fe-2S)-binding protein [Proteobacteria bacterium]|jgi:aerobic-type carbon monoxide dehydrogenase small subunit (CoxS/CutS family)|nr:(2Fe-2S)-binding protein [Pseudomonadota bacterium]